MAGAGHGFHARLTDTIEYESTPLEAVLSFHRSLRLRAFVTTRPREIKIVDDTAEEIGCDGGGGALGHPKVYLPFEGRRHVDCYYCGQRFAKPGYESTDAQHA
jgi:uncharacterized Zn-finger protein